MPTQSTFCNFIVSSSFLISPLTPAFAAFSSSYGLVIRTGLKAIALPPARFSLRAVITSGCTSDLVSISTLAIQTIIGGGLTATLEIPDSVEICFSMAAAQEAHFGKLISIQKCSGATVSPFSRETPTRPYTAPRATSRCSPPGP